MMSTVVKVIKKRLPGSLTNFDGFVIEDIHLGAARKTRQDETYENVRCCLFAVL